MKPATIGCIVGSAAALVLTGCADERYGVVTRDSSYVATTGEPEFVERRVVLIENREQTVPIYRTGDAYFYSWGGRRYTLADYPSLTRTRVIRGPAYSSARYRTVDRDWVDRDWDDRRRIRRSARRLDLDDDLRYRSRVQDIDVEYDEDAEDLSLKW